MKTKALILFLYSIFQFNFLFGQVSTSYYASNGFSKIGLGYDFFSRFWGELRVYGSSAQNKVKPELAFHYNFINNERHSLYLGIGGTPSNQYGIMVPVGVKINSGSVLKNTCIHIEIEPTYDGVNERSYLYGVIGFRYYFMKKQD